MQINQNGNWRLYTNTLPANSTPLGTITVGGCDTGALARINATGVYVQVNAGAIKRLDGRKVAAALGLLGRPPIPPDQRSDAKPRSVRLSEARWAKLKSLGTEWLERQIDKAK